MTDQRSLARLQALYDAHISLDEMARDPELRADFLAGLDNDTARRTQLGQLIDYLVKNGYLARRAGDQKGRHATASGEGSQNQAQIPEQRRSTYDRMLERYEQFIRASCRRREYTRLSLQGRTETVVISDLHIPDERPDLIAEVCTRHKGARLVIAGDINDFQKYSRYEVEELDLPTMRDAFAQTDALLGQLTEFFPEVVVMFGNHDLRLERKVRRLLGEEFAWMTGEFHRMAYERRHGVKVVSHVVERISGRSIEGLHYWYQIGDCLVSHAERAGKSHAKGAIDAHDFFYSHQKSGTLPITPFRLLLQAHCFAADTEILTRGGWKTFDQVSVGEEALTYNLQTGVSEWNPIQEVVHYDHYKELVQFKSTITDLLVTPDHAVVVAGPHAKRRSSFHRSEAKNWVGKMVKMPCGGENINPDYPISDNLLRLLAWVITEGDYCKDSCNIRIAQSNKPKVDVHHVTGICEAVGIPFSVYKKHAAGTTRHGQYRNYDAFSIRLLSSEVTRRIREILPDKQLAWWMLDLSHRQFLLFFKELMLGDGSKNAASEVCYQYLSKNEQEIDILQALCAFNGYRSSKTRQKRQHPYWVLSVCTRGTSIVKGGTQVPYEGRVWCARVENQTLVTRRNGKVVVSGNTHKRCWVEHPITGVQCVEIGAMCDVQAYSLKNPRYGPIQNGYFYLIQYDGVTDLNESRLWILE